MPWLIGDEWKEVSKLKSRYIFGHFELPLFYMNAMVQMPDHGQLQGDHFVNQEYVFTGHFHKRQHNRNIHYIGNAFPHNYADAGDDERGMMLLEWGDAVGDALGTGLIVKLAANENADTQDSVTVRQIDIDWRGMQWETRWDKLRSSLDTWATS
jgi:hypothetical protein